jgi:hypothetical protein
MNADRHGSAVPLCGLEIAHEAGVLRGFSPGGLADRPRGLHMEMSPAVEANDESQRPAIFDFADPSQDPRVRIGGKD